MHKIKEKLMDELYEIEEKMKKSSGKVSAGDLEYIHKLTDTVKNIDKIEILEEDDGYSEDGQYMGEGRIYGTTYEGGSSYRRGRGRNAKRDSMGRYSSDGYRINNRGGYSRNSAKDYMMEQLEEMMEQAEKPQEKEALKRCMQAIERA